MVTTVEHSEEALRDALGGDVAELRVVTPVVELSKLDWLTNDEDDARREAEKVAQRTADALPGRTVDAGAGDTDPLTAVEDALRTFPADEVVVVTRPDDEATWLEEGRGEAAAHRISGVPVRHLALADDS